MFCSQYFWSDLEGGSGRGPALPAEGTGAPAGSSHGSAGTLGVNSVGIAASESKLANPSISTRRESPKGGELRSLLFKAVELDSEMGEAPVPSDWGAWLGV